MTQDPLAELRNLSNKAAKENEYLNARPFNRCAAIDFEGDIPRDGLIRAVVTRDNFDPKEVLRVTVRSARVYKSASTNPMGDTFTFDVTIPVKANINSEFNQMQGSLEAVNPAYTSLVDLAGSHIKVEERCHTFIGRQDTGKPRIDPKTGLQQIGRDGKPQNIWEERPFNVFYYHVTAVSGGSVASVAQEVGPISAAVLNDALVYSMEHSDDELASVGSTLKGLQEKGIDFQDLTNSPLSEAVMTGKLREYLEAALPKAVTA